MGKSARPGVVGERRFADPADEHPFAGLGELEDCIRFWRSTAALDEFVSSSKLRVDKVTQRTAGVGS
jgi:hypothetical protein